MQLRVAAAGPRLWQVGAWSDPANASAAADKIRGAVGSAAGVIVESASRGLTRVRVGWTAAEPPEAVKSLAGQAAVGAVYPYMSGVIYC